MRSQSSPALPLPTGMPQPYGRWLNAGDGESRPETFVKLVIPAGQVNSASCVLPSHSEPSH